MAFERNNFSVSMRYFLLIALLILIIHALSSDYGVNGEETDEKDKDGVKKSVRTPPGKNHTRKKRRTTVSAPSPPDSSKTTAGNLKPVTNIPAVAVPPQNPENKGEPLKGPLGSTDGIKKAEGDSVVGRNDDTDDDTEEKKRDDDKKSAPDKPTKTQAEEAGKVPVLKKKATSDDVSSAGSFMTYFVIIAIVVIIAYLILHNKKKLMAYFIEGRNTARVRRQRPTSGSEYKPLKNIDEVPGGGRPDEA